MLVHSKDPELVVALKVGAYTHEDVTLVAELLDNLVALLHAACLFHPLLYRLGRKRRRELSVREAQGVDGHLSIVVVNFALV